MCLCAQDLRQSVASHGHLQASQHRLGQLVVRGAGLFDPRVRAVRDGPQVAQDARVRRVRGHPPVKAHRRGVQGRRLRVWRRQREVNAQ